MKKVLSGLVICSLMALNIQSAHALGRRIRITPESSSSTPAVKLLELSELLYSLRLTEDQKKEIAIVLVMNKEDVKSALEGMAAGAKDLSAAVNASTFDEQAIRAAHQALAAQSEEFAVLRGKIISEVRPILTAEQKAQISKFKQKFSAAVQKRLKTAQQVINNWIKKYLPSNETE